MFNDEPIGNKRFEALNIEQLLHVDMMKCVMDSLDSRHTNSRGSSPLKSENHLIEALSAFIETINFLTLDK